MVMNISRLLLLVLTLILTLVFVSRAFGGGDNEDLKSKNENKHEVSCLYSPPLRIKTCKNRLRASQIERQLKEYLH